MRTLCKFGKPLALTIIVSLIAVGCTATRGRRGEPEESGFLRNYSQLQPVEGYPAARVYIKPGVPWANYNSVMIDSVGLWGDASQNISPEDQKMLTDVLYKSLYNDISKYFKVVNQPGPNTIRLRVAMTQVGAAKPVLRTITTVIPQLRVVGTIVGLSADTAATVGSATVEMEALDSVTGE